MASVTANRFHEAWESGAVSHDRATTALVVPRSLDPDAAGLVPHATLTYGELLDNAARIASWLAARGVGRGDRVLFLAPPGIELYQSMLGVLKAGATSAFANPAERFADFEACMGKLRPKALFGVARAHQLRFVSATLQKVPVLVGIGQGSWGWSPPPRFDAILREGDPTFGTVAVDGDEAALVSFTTGSTGRPKGVVRTHRELKHIFEALCRHPRKREKGTNYCAFPNLPFDDLTAGRTSVLAAVRPGRPLDSSAPAMLAQMSQYPPRIVSFPPRLLALVVEEAIRRGATFPSVLHLFVGAGPTPPRLVSEFTRVFPSARLSILYGSTEVEPISHIAAEELTDERRARQAAGEGICVGRPEGLDVRVIPVTPGPLDRVPDPVAGIGEIVIRGAHVNREYLENPEETRAHKILDVTSSTSDGRAEVWHRMGDLGTVDADGMIWLRGRVRHAVTLEGVEIHPMAIEGMVDLVPGVRQSALLMLELGGLRGQDLARDAARTIPVLAIEGADRAEIEPRIRALPLPAPLRDVTLITVNRIPMDRRLGAKLEYEELAGQLEGPLRERLCEPFEKRLQAYLRARFPPGDTAIGAGVFVVGLLAAGGVAAWSAPLRPAIAFLVVFGFFFHLRCFDELKDSAVDRLLYPDRPVSRRVVGLDEIRWCLRRTTLFEAMGAALLGAGPFMWWTAAFLYSCLMRVEFFCRDWLRAHIFVYGISHVMVVFLLAQFVIATMRPGEIHVLPGMVAVCLAWFAEIARKLVPRGDETVREEHRQLDESYVRDLGMGWTVILLMGILAVGLAAGMGIGSATGRSWKYHAALGASGALVAAATLQFLREPTEKRGKKAHGASLLWALVQYSSLALTL